jgi:hypothetical protein
MSKLVELLESERPAYPETPYDVGYNNGLTMAIAIVGKQKDLENVVRCKDCKHYVWSGNLGFCDNPDGLLGFDTPDEFCSHGEAVFG